MGENKIELPKGDTMAIVTTLLDPNGAALDLTGASIWMSSRVDKALATYTDLDLCEAAWTELLAGVTATADSDAQEGEKSVKLAITDPVAAGAILATKAITETDLSGHSSVHLFVKSSVSTNAGDLQLLLDDTALCASPRKTLDLPALTANTWTKVVLFFDSTYHAADDDLTGIISVGIKMVVDKGIFDLYLDEIRAGKYLIEKFAGDYGADPLLGKAYFLLATALTKYVDPDTYDFDIQTYWSGTGVKYTPIIDDLEILAHASDED